LQTRTSLPLSAAFSSQDTPALQLLLATLWLKEKSAANDYYGDLMVIK
jgi:hypothetical protein